MASAVTVRKVENTDDFKAFFTFPWKLYADDPNWVPPLKSIRSDTLNKEKNPSWDYLEGDYFAAWKDDQIVGTIVAFVNHWHNEFHKENIAWFGFFETVNDENVAHALLNTAVEWATSRGYDALRGPQSFTTHEECGLLINGFERPVMLMPYNPPYYQALVESVGFHKVQDVFSYYANWNIMRQSRFDERVQRLVDRVARKANLHVRPIDNKNLKREFQHFKSIYNDAWEKNWGFTPMTEKELDALVKSLGMIFDPRLGCFVVDGDEPVAFILGVPDFNQVLERARPHPTVPEPITLIRALWHWKIRPKIDTFRVPLMGVKQAYRNKGADLLLYHYILSELPKLPTQYVHLDAGWILESNQNMMGLLETMGLELYRTYRFYEMPLK